MVIACDSSGYVAPVCQELLPDVLCVGENCCTVVHRVARFSLKPGGSSGTAAVQVSHADPGWTDRTVNGPLVPQGVS